MKPDLEADAQMRADEADRHGDQSWEVELAERARAEDEKHRATGQGQLFYYIRVLQERYAERRPVDLSDEHRPIHAEYLARRYRRIARRALRLIRPDNRAEYLNRPCLRENVQWQVYFKSACDARDQIKEEMEESIRYWAWVHEHNRLPLKLAPRLGRFNHRSIAHPWTSISIAALECLGLVEPRLKH